MDRIITVCIILLTFGATSLAPAHVRAEPDTPLQIIGQPNGVQIAWQSPADGFASNELSLATVAFGGNAQPGQLVGLQINSDEPISPHIRQLTTTPWSGKLAAEMAPIPQTLDGELRPDLAQPVTQSLPDAPIVVLREGYMRGQRVVVVLISPIFMQDGAQVMATQLDGFIPEARVFDQTTESLLANSRPFLVSAPAPSNPAAREFATIIHVTHSGIQEASGAALAASGLDISNHTLLHLYHRGTEVALEVHDGGDGNLDTNDTIRFYAPLSTNRWNMDDRYWLTAERTVGLRMTRRTSQSGTAPLQNSAYQSGIWRQNTSYDTTVAGPDGDHWFTTKLQTGPGLEPTSYLAVLQRSLPLADGSATFTVSGSAFTAGKHQLRLGQGVAKLFLPLVTKPSEQAQLAKTSSFTKPQPTQESPPPVVWSGTGDWSHSFTLHGRVAMIEMTQVPGEVPDGLELDSIAWRRPVALDFGGQGAPFETDSGDWQYQLQNTAPDRVLYDITNPDWPARVDLPEGTTTTLQDDSAARRYLLTGPGVVHSPAVFAHTPVDLAAPLNADALYIAPSIFEPDLAPLVALRQQQGYIVKVVDVQAIYDSWSYGQVSPEAIRSFLRYAAATWSRVPRAVALVGDGTIDPLNYYNNNRNGRNNNVNLIPSYVAMIDPWVGETACDTCYGMLSSDNPLDDLLPDLAIGRLPVKRTAELVQMVAKLIAYENAPANESWRSQEIFIADNYREATGQTDNAGDFAAASDATIALQPAGISVERIYYDPTSVDVPWREADPTRAAQRTHAALNNGASIFNYYGHSNQFQLAVTNLVGQAGPGYLLRLDGIDSLTNAPKLPVALQMTCLTSAFQTPSMGGTTIDERLVLSPNGGAIATWGSSGLGVSFGHDMLQRGFYRALWRGENPQTSATLGTLITAGYQTLFTEGRCCQESIATFLLLGDPLTVLRMRRAS